MSEIRRIVTHAGGAHKDDLLGCCVLIAQHDCPIFRRDPSAEELADATVAIVDVGGSHDPTLRNFDKGLDEVIGAIVYRDRRGGVYGISRYEDDPRLDFSQLVGQEDVHFAHKSGFMCKTSATDPQRLRELIQGAVKR